MGQTGTGLDSQLGWVKQAALGTPDTPTRFLRFDSETFGLNRPTVEDDGLMVGEYTAREKGEVIVGRHTAGGATMSLHDSGFGLILAAATGLSTNTPRAGAAGVFDQVHKLGSMIGNLLTVQKGVPRSDGSGVIEPHTFHDVKISDMDITIASSQIAKIAVTCVGSDERTLGTVPAGLPLAVAAPSTTSRPFSFTGASLTLDGTPVVKVKSANVKLTNPYTSADDRRYLNSGGLPDEYLVNGKRTVDGTLGADYANRTTFYDAFRSNAAKGLLLTFVGQQIGSTGINASLAIAVPAIKFQGETPKIGGPGLVAISAPYKGFNNDTDPTITYTLTSGDAAF